MVRYIFSAVILLLTATFASAQGYKIQSGDVLQIEVLEDAALNRSLLVLPDGSISFPLAGTIQAGGRTTDSVKNAIQAALAPNFAAAPTVFVAVTQLSAPASSGSGSSSFDVFVMGEVNSPGKVAVKPGTSLLQTLAQVGGFTKFAATKRIQIRRINKKSKTAQTFTFDYKAIESGMSNGQIIVLRSGDVVIVPERRLFE